eukprot:scaffold300938_cov22-Tisochrysis_lutea.AAC.1
MHAHTFIAQWPQVAAPPSKAFSASIKTRCNSLPGKAHQFSISGMTPGLNVTRLSLFVRSQQVQLVLLATTVGEHGELDHPILKGKDAIKQAYDFATPGAQG